MNFRLKNLADWKRVILDTVIQFDCNGRSRDLVLEVNTDQPVVAYASYGSEGNEVLLGAGTGQFSISLTMSERLGVTFIQGDGAEPNVFYKTKAQSHLVENSGAPTLTTIERRPARNSDFDRMVAMMRHNEEQRNQRLASEIAKLKAQADAVTTPATTAKAQADEKPAKDNTDKDDREGTDVADKGGSKATGNDTAGKPSASHEDAS